MIATKFMHPCVFAKIGRTCPPAPIPHVPCPVAGCAGTIFRTLAGLSLTGLLLFPLQLTGAVLFQDDFEEGIPGWTAVQPPGAYVDGPLRWQYDVVSGALVEQSNIYTDNATSSPTAVAPMLINETVTALNFTFSARLTAGDDDGFGLIFGYSNPTNFYRVTFARQARTGFPWTGWSVDRKVDGATVNLFGAGTAGYVQTFVNTAGRPFDVTISVDTANRLTLTLVDNPTGTPVNYTLVNAQLLPAPANGKVGLMTWGMSGGNPRGFRIQNLSLTPAGLAGGAKPLANWTPLVPPRASGSVAVSGEPLWSVQVGINGPLGYLSESGDCFGGNDAAGQTDFTGPTLVAGDAGWTDYVMAVRILPRDDDGHGIVLRYSNPTNFYRVMLRSQNSTIGAPRGLSVQKNVNRVYSEVYRETAVQYDPIANVPYDLVTRISNSTLEVLLVADPEGTARPYTYGPWNIAGVPAGRIGLVSWAMADTLFDRVSVQDGTPLYVSSAHDSCNPGRGLQGFAAGTEVTATATTPASPPGVRVTPRGWTGAGSVPPAGSGSSVVFTITNFSRLHWLWKTEYQLAWTNGPGGTVNGPAEEWFESGVNVPLTAQADSGYVFSRWEGTVLSTSPNLSVNMDRPHQIQAVFAADTDADGLPDEWELASFGNLAQTAGGDPDGDGRTNAQEYAAGTHPMVPDIFRIERVELTPSASILTISNGTGTRYNVQQAAAPLGTWSTIATAQASDTYLAGPPAAASTYWRLQQPARPADALPFVPGSWTIVVLPDTQIYAQSYPDLFIDQTRWIVQNRLRHSIKYVLHLGDITNNNNTNQWENARAAMSMLDGEVPYAFVPGNHDYGPNGGTADRTTLLNGYFPSSNYVSWPTFGGTMSPGQMENSYHLFSAGGADWLILALEFGPRNSVVTWANSIVQAHPNRRVILITHAYMYSDETRYDWAAKGSSQSWNPYAYGTASDSDGTNDGEDLWNKLVKQHAGFTMVLNGHVLNDGLGRLSSTNNAGNVVHQMLVNYQMQALGGAAFLRLIEFLPDGKTVQVKAYSPYNGTYKTDPQNQFVLNLDPPL